MAHTHDEVHREVDVIEREGSPGLSAGLLVAVAAIVVFAVIALAVLFARPWDDGNADNTPNVPGITDNNSAGGNSSGAGGDTGGGSGGAPGDGGGAQPAR